MILGMRTSEMEDAEMAALIELIEAFGAQNRKSMEGSAMASRDGGEAADGETKMTDSEFEMRSDSPNVRKVVDAMWAAADATLAELELKEPLGHITLAMALACLVWESGQRHERIATSTIKLLLNMAVDHGIAEKIGMVQMAGPEETIN